MDYSLTRGGVGTVAAKQNSISHGIRSLLLEGVLPASWYRHSHLRKHCTAARRNRQQQPNSEFQNRSTSGSTIAGGSPLISKSPTLPSRAIPLSAILLIALAVHGPLLLMQLPAGSYDANTHIFFAAHYAHHWFNPWNEKWFGGFSQTTYPPLTHQWIALFSHIMGLKMAYMFVQFMAILLLPIGMYRYARCGSMKFRPAMPRWVRCSWVRWRCWSISRDSCPPRRRPRSCSMRCPISMSVAQWAFSSLLKGVAHSVGGSRGTPRYAIVWLGSVRHPGAGAGHPRSRRYRRGR